jgi:hypothetical protein
MVPCCKSAPPGGALGPAGFTRLTPDQVAVRGALLSSDAEAISNMTGKILPVPFTEPKRAAFISKLRSNDQDNDSHG